MSHVAETDLALLGTGDLSMWRQTAVKLHVSFCRRCAERVEQYRRDRGVVRALAAQMPAGVDWDKLSAEMTANIHLGIEAGECVTPRGRTPIFKPNEGWASRWAAQWMPASFWKPAAVAMGVTVLLSGAWWLNVPPSGADSLMQAFRNIANGGRAPQAMLDDRVPVVEVTDAGVRVRENGSILGVRLTQPNARPARPVVVSVSVQGSASAHYVDNDTGQVTVTSVYVD
jgi:hypothetical protein